MPPQYFTFRLADNVIVSVYFSTARGKVTEFVVKLELELEGGIHEVIRYDAAHGGPHKDVLMPDGSKYDVVPYHNLGIDEGFTFAVSDIKENWAFYTERFLRWLKAKEKN